MTYINYKIYSDLLVYKNILNILIGRSDREKLMSFSESTTPKYPLKALTFQTPQIVFPSVINNSVVEQVTRGTLHYYKRSPCFHNFLGGTWFPVNF